MFRAGRVRSWILVSLLLLASVSEGQISTDAAVVRQALSTGAYDRAEAVAGEQVAEVERTAGRQTLAWAEAADLYVRALVRNGRAGAPATMRVAESAIGVKKQLLPADDVRLADSLIGLAQVLQQHGQFARALELQRQALALRLPARDAAAIAESREALASTLLLSGRFDEARASVESALPARESRADTEPLLLARAVLLLGQIESDAGRYVVAAPALDRAVALWRRHAPDHPDLAEALGWLGLVQFLRGQIPDARATWLEALDIAERALHPAHPLIAVSLRNAAIGDASVGDLARARAYRERAVTIAGQSVPRCNRETTYYFNDLAISRRHDGDYALARRLYQQALDVVRSCMGPTHEDAGTALYNMFQLARDTGAWAEAERLGLQAVDVWSRRLGREHPFVAYGLTGLGSFYSSRARYARAQAVLTEALGIRRRTLGEQHPDIGALLTELAEAVGDGGNLTRALALVEQGLQILSRAPARDPDYVARALVVRGSFHMRGGRYADARDDFRQALEMRERTFGPSHPAVADTQSALARTSIALDDRTTALAMALSAEHTGRDLLRFTARFMPETRALAYAAARPRGLDLALSVAVADRAIDPAGTFETLIQSRGIVLDEMIARARAAAGADTEQAALSAALAEARQRHANLVLREAQGDPVDRTLMDEVRRTKEAAEEALAARSPVTRAELARSKAGLAQIRGALPQGAALISIVRYDRQPPLTGGARLLGAPVASYAAFVVRADANDVRLVPMGPAAAMDGAVALWREAVSAPVADVSASAAHTEGAYRAVAAQLRRRSWDRLTPHLAGISTVFVVPDGALNLVNFSALPIGTRRYVVDEGVAIHYLTGERDLLPDDTARDGRGLLAVGGADFAQPPVRTGASATIRGGCDAGALQFTTLPGTRAEISDLARLWAPAETTLLMGRSATPAQVARTARGKRVLHLATHGFFLDGPCAPRTGATRGVGGLAPTKRGARPEENPLLMGGLALAGANHYRAVRPGQDDGILTSEEVASLDLGGTEWAVLSACDTGLGQVRAGEGVLGLRRAFRVAGVRTVIMSLWSVEDESTRHWMLALYQGRLEAGLDTSAAVRHATLATLTARRASGGSTHPFYWAAFVAAGDWR